MNTSKKFDFNNFKPHPLLAPGSDEWFRIVNSGKEYAINKDQNGLFISLYKEKNAQTFEYGDTTMVIENLGEWGGSITVTSKKDPASHRIARDYPVKFIFTWQEKMYVVESLSHMYLSLGKIFEFISDKSNFELKEALDLGEAPEAYTITEGELYMVSDKNLWVIRDKSGILSKEDVIQDLPFEGLYPNSLVKEGGVFYIGMRGGFAKIDLAVPQHVSYYMLS